MTRIFRMLISTFILTAMMVIAFPARAQTSSLADWTFKIAGLTVVPSVSVTPDIFSFKDLSFSSGPNVGAGIDVLWPNGYGFSPHLAVRDTSVGAKPLASLFAVLPPIAQYGLRPGVMYQFNGGTAPWRDGFLFGVSGATNLTMLFRK